MICYEVGFDGLVSSEVGAGANLLAVQSNDADLRGGRPARRVPPAAGHGPDPRGRVRTARVVYASTTGVSAIIAPGRGGARAQRHLAAGRAGGTGAAAHQRYPRRPARRLAGGGDHRLTLAALAWAIGRTVRDAPSRRQRSATPGWRRRPRLTGWRVRGTGRWRHGPHNGAHGAPGAMRALWRALDPASARYAALAAGALPVLAFPAPNLEFLGWFGLVPGLLLIRPRHRAGRRRSAAGGSGPGSSWPRSTGWPRTSGPALLLVAIVLGALWTGFGCAAWRAAAAAGSPPAAACAALVVVPSYWLLTEWTRSWQGVRRAVGAARRQPVAAPGGARAGRGGRGMAGQLRPGRGQHRHRDPADRAAGPGPAALGAAAAAVAMAAGPVVFALTPGTACRPARDGGAGPAGDPAQPAASRVNASQRLSAGWARPALT